MADLQRDHVRTTQQLLKETAEREEFLRSQHAREVAEVVRAYSPQLDVVLRVALTCHRQWAYGHWNIGTTAASTAGGGPSQRGHVRDDADVAGPPAHPRKGPPHCRTGSGAARGTGRSRDSTGAASPRSRAARSARDDDNGGGGAGPSQPRGIAPPRQRHRGPYTDGCRCRRRSPRGLRRALRERSGAGARRTGCGGDTQAYSRGGGALRPPVVVPSPATPKRCYVVFCIAPAQ